MSDPVPVITPNVVIGNPSIRKAVNIAVSTALVLVGTAAAVDGASPDFDIAWLTVPALVGLSYIAAAFNLGITLPNVPR